MIPFFGVMSFIGCIVFVILLIVMKNSRKYNLVGLICCFVVFVALMAYDVGNGGTQGEITSGIPVAENQQMDAATPAPTPTPTPADEPKEESFEIVDSSILAWENSIGSTWCKIVTEVKNTGTAPLYLSAADFDIEDSAGSLLSVANLVSVYPPVINPGESAVYFETTMLDGIAPEAVQNIIPHVKAEKAKVEQILFPTSDVKITDEIYGGIKAIGRVENNTAETQDSVYVAVVCRDANAKAVAVLMTILTGLAPGDKVGFEATALSLPDGLTAASVSSFETYAYPLQFQF